MLSVIVFTAVSFIESICSSKETFIDICASTKNNSYEINN